MVYFKKWFAKIYLLRATVNVDQSASVDGVEVAGRAVHERQPKVEGHVSASAEGGRHHTGLVNDRHLRERHRRPARRATAV